MSLERHNSFGPPFGQHPRDKFLDLSPKKTEGSDRTDLDGDKTLGYTNTPETVHQEIEQALSSDGSFQVNPEPVSTE